MKKATLLAFLLIFCVFSTKAQDKPIIVVEQFTVGKNVKWAGGPWPYDMGKLRDKLGDHLKIYLDNADKFEIVTAEPSVTTTGPIYLLGGEVLEWHKGNAAIITGMGLGRESARIRYWLRGQNGKKIFDHEDIIRTTMNGSGHRGHPYHTIGTLPEPLVSKIVDRINEAKVL